MCLTCEITNFGLANSMVSAGVFVLFLGTREEMIWAENPRYIAVILIAERVIAGSDCMRMAYSHFRIISTPREERHAW